MTDISCADCDGLCCKGAWVGPFKGATPDLELWVKWHKLDREIWIETPCIYLDNGQCLIHETKPQICKEEPSGGPMCRKVRKWFGVDDDNPG